MYVPDFIGWINLKNIIDMISDFKTDSMQTSFFTVVFRGLYGWFSCSLEHAYDGKNCVFMLSIFTFSRFIYPGMVAFVISSLTFPPGFGQFFAGMVSLLGSWLVVTWKSLKKKKISMSEQTIKT